MALGVLSTVNFNQERGLFLTQLDQSDHNLTYGTKNKIFIYSSSFIEMTATWLAWSCPRRLLISSELSLCSSKDL